MTHGRDGEAAKLIGQQAANVLGDIRNAGRVKDELRTRVLLEHTIERTDDERVIPAPKAQHEKAGRAIGGQQEARPERTFRNVLQLLGPACQRAHVDHAVYSLQRLGELADPLQVLRREEAFGMRGDEDLRRASELPLDALRAL